jgi:hypothetical protein
VGLKIRRLRSGFAYYAEYKFGGGRCVYETIKAGSSREARRIYAARYSELRAGNAAEVEIKAKAKPKPGHDRHLAAAFSAVLRALVARRVVSEAEASELLPQLLAPNLSDNGAAVDFMRPAAQLVRGGT